MPTRSSKKGTIPPEDTNEIAFRVVRTATEEKGEAEKPSPPKKAKKNPAAVALGRKGGKKDGKARAEKLSKEQLSEIGRKGAATRWGKRTDKNP